MSPGARVHANGGHDHDTARILAFLALALASASLLAQEARIGSEISFRGQLNQVGAPASGQYDFRLRLFDAETGGTLIASRDIPSIAVFEGRYSFPVDFGATAFSGGQRWIEVQVQDPNGTGGYQALSRRTEVFVVPYAETAMAVRGGHVRANPSCPSGQVVAGVNVAGNLICVAGGGGGTGGTVNMFSRIVVVPGDDTPLNNGEALRAAVAFVTQQPRDADNRWKILLEPGTFDLGQGGIGLARWITLEGSGREVTNSRSRFLYTRPCRSECRYRRAQYHRGQRQRAGSVLLFAGCQLQRGIQYAQFDHRERHVRLGLRDRSAVSGGNHILQVGASRKR